MAVYLWKNEYNDVIHHDTIEEGIKEFDREPDIILDDEQEIIYHQSGDLARVIDDVIFIGKTEEELENEKIEATISNYQSKLKNTDYVAIKLSEVQDDREEYQKMKEKYKDVLADRKKWREYIRNHRYE